MPPPTVRLENDKVRVVEFRLAPGDKAAMHTYPEPYVAYVLGSASVRISFPDGKSIDAQMKAGEVLWRPPVTYAFENVGNSELHELMVAIKAVPPNSSSKPTAVETPRLSEPPGPAAA